MVKMESRNYNIVGRPEDLDALEKALRHIEYLGQIGASRNIMIRVDGDGAGRISVYRNEDKVLDAHYRPIDNEHYNKDQDKLINGCVGVYDIG